jgi:S1-C subfamily serine protease
MAPETPTFPVDPPAELYVLKHGEMFGPFHEEQLRRGVEEGHFAAEDFTQIEGQEGWHPIGLGMDEAELRGAVAPDWVSILKWGWIRLRYHVGEQSLAAGSAFLAIGTLALALSRWPFVFWLPWFGAAVVCAIPLLRRKREAHGALLLVGVVCIPFLFIIFGSKHIVHESPGAGETPSAGAAPHVVAEKHPSLFPATAPKKPQAPGIAPTAASLPPASQSAPDSIPGLSAPEPLTPHYAAVPSADIPPAVLPSNPAISPSNPTILPSIPKVEEFQSPKPAPGLPAQVDFAHDHDDALVIVKGSEGSGSGFICSTGKGAMLFTNTHVIADITDPTVTRMDGVIVAAGAAEVAAGRDIARLALSEAPNHPLEVIADFNNNVRMGDAVVVLGNSGGGGVVTKIEGNIVGIGPDRIEVSAEFIPGNSGSPIIHVKTGQVIGIATYLTKRYEEFSSSNGGPTPPASGSNKSSLGAVVVRRFGYRMDNAAAWEPVEWNEFRSEATRMRQISALTGDIFDFMGSLRAKAEPHFATETLRRPATEWLGSLQTKHVSDFDRQSSTRGFLNSLRFMVRSDVAAAEPRLRYTYFRDELKEERRVRDLLYKSFDEESAKLSEPANHPTSIRKSQ